MECMIIDLVQLEVVGREPTAAEITYHHGHNRQQTWQFFYEQGIITQEQFTRLSERSTQQVKIILV